MRKKLFTPQPKATIKVRNINGTSDNSCNCGSWLAHWELFSEKTAGLCVEVACTTAAEVGAHVQKAGSGEAAYDKYWYIIPLCKEHNKSEELEINSSVTLVYANVSETCGK